MWRVLTLVLATAALLCALPSAAAGQVDGSRLTARDEGGRYFDYYVSRFRLSEGSGGATEDGVGGRMMWSVAPLLRSGSPWLDRALVGGYLTHTPEDGDRHEMWRYGAQVDYIVTPEPLVGRVEPLVSLAAGAVRVTEPGMQWSSVPYLIPREEAREGGVGTPILSAALPDRVSTRPSVTPGIGARVRILPGLSLRTDARQVIDFRDEVVSNFELSAGISVGME